MMGKEKNLHGVRILELGLPGDGVMGSNLTQFNEIEFQSLVIEGVGSKVIHFDTEADDNFFTVSDGKVPLALRVRLFEVDLSNYPLLMGGTYANGRWDAPNVMPEVHLSCRLTSFPVNGVSRVLEIPYGHVTAKIEGKVSLTTLPALEIALFANVPVSVAGNKGSPYSIIEI